MCFRLHKCSHKCRAKCTSAHLPPALVATSAQVQGQVHKCRDKCALVPCTCPGFTISSPIHLIAAQSHRGIYEYAQAPECCNVKTGHLGLDLGHKLSKLSLKDHCSRDPVQVQSLYGREPGQIESNPLSFVASSWMMLEAFVYLCLHLYTCPCTCAILHLCTCALVGPKPTYKLQE